MELFRIELKRAIFNKWTLISISIALVICLIPIPEKYEYMNMLNNDNAFILDNGKVLCTTTAYQHWLLYDRFDNTIYIFLFILPILAALPYGASYYTDVKNGYIKNLLSRCSMREYCIAKYIATFITGGAVITVPIVVQFLILGLIFPLYTPYRTSIPITGETSFGLDLLLDYPLLNTLMWCIIIFLVSGLLATISLSVSRYIYNFFGIILTPFVLSFFLIFLVYLTGIHEIAFIYSISSWSSYDYNYFILFGEIIILFVITFFTFVFQKKEVL